LTSREKVLRLRERVLALKPEDEESAQMLQIGAGLMPLVVKALPDDPEQLDRYLEVIAAGAAACRSDDAPVLALHRWNESLGAWEEVE